MPERYSPIRIFPVGDIVYGDGEAAFAESFGDVGMRNVVAEHAINHVAFQVREAGDFAVASEFSGWLRGRSRCLLYGGGVQIRGRGWKDGEWRILEFGVLCVGIWRLIGL